MSLRVMVGVKRVIDYAVKVRTKDVYMECDTDSVIGYPQTNFGYSISLQYPNCYQEENHGMECKIWM